MNSFGRVFRVSVAGESHGPAAMALCMGIPSALSKMLRMAIKEKKRTWN